MTDTQIKRMAGALVPLSLFVLAYLLLSPPSWADALRTALDKEPGLVVIDDAVPFDPSDLRGIIWMSESAFRAPMLKQLSRVLWLRPAQADQAQLAGYTPKVCKQAHGVTLCVIDKASKEPWRLSRHLKGVQARTSKGSCTSRSNTKKCMYGEQDWEYLRREEHQFNGRKLDCIWSHPVAGEDVVITTPKLAAGTYTLSAGIDDSGMRGNLPPVEVDIVLDGSTEPIQIRSGAERGFRQHKLPEFKSEQALTLNIRAEKTGARFFCWDLIRDR